ncbi:MAG: ADP-forming succinate--CoA ligase subunit beta [Armatimonadetes bacterium]|nr:ADP-forming succinate--CoA ligase subunit beta [Armatimonadota bacterium]
MKIHEYQAKQLFDKFGIPTTSGSVALTPEEAVCMAQAMGLPVVLKAQVLTGGRGKAGGVRIARSLDEVREFAGAILALTIKDFAVRKLLITPAINICSESYLGLLIDRGVSKITFIGCAEGGVEIEETAKTSPEKILRLELTVKQASHLTEKDCLPFALKLLPKKSQANDAAKIMVLMAKMFLDQDCSLIEINPLVVDDAGKVLALDAKVLFDDNAQFRHPEHASMLDLDSEDADEISARVIHLTFVRLDGNVGCMVNGAGLAMATMDTIKYFNGSPANFLDAGGSSDPAKAAAGLKLILSDDRVKAIFINIFGGITRCDDIAKGILAARELFEVTVPVVIRLEGTNEKEGQALIAGSGMIVAESMEQGAQKAVEMGQRA